MPGGFSLIADPFDVTVDLPIELTPGMRLRKANDDEIAFVKRVCPSPGFLGDGLETRFEFDWIHSTENPNAQSWHPQPIPQAAWRYYVAEFDDNGMLHYEVDQIARLARPPFGFLAVVHHNVGGSGGPFSGWGIDVWPMVTKLGPTPEPPKIFTGETASDVRMLHARLKYIGERYPDISTAVRFFYELRRIPEYSDLYVLGLFATMEMVLTHQPGDQERGDSLRHQISEKIPLIDRRSDDSLHYALCGKDADAREVWKRLYDYRSGLAHGNRSLAERMLKKLNGRENALELLKQGVRSVLRAGLIEPDLIEDLKRV